jgi:hypothetical protein
MNDFDTLGPIAMLHLTKLRDLTLVAASDPQRPAYISAASGLVRAGKYLYVVADDELHLARFELSGTVPGELLRLLPGELPDKKKPRKKRKPDFEVLLQLPAFVTCPHGALLALGSGSTARRYRAVLVPLDKHGEVQPVPQVLEASAFYELLARQFDELNLEGGWVQGNELRLLQRGNKGNSPNAIIHLELQALLASLSGGDQLPAITPLAIHTMELGHINQVPLCFSDGCALADGRWLFTAVAEDTDSAYEDGACVGAAVGMVDAKGHLLWIKQVTPSYKIEGIEARQEAEGIHLLLVTDADDVAVPASLLSAVV